MLWFFSSMTKSKTSMEAPQEIQPQKSTRDNGKRLNSHIESSDTSQKKITSKLIYYKWWLRMTLYVFFLLAGQSAATLLGRLYFDKGGNSKWMATFVQSAGFPILLPLLLFFSSSPSSSEPEPKLLTLIYLYVGFGLILMCDNMMYSHGLAYLPVSTCSLLGATQLAFNAIFSFFINSHKITSLILNSLVLLTISAALLAVNAHSEKTTGIDAGKYAIGFFCTLGGSALFALYLSLVQFSFVKIIKRETFSIVLDMQIYPSLVTTCGCVVGLFASGEWRSLSKEMRECKMGQTSYMMNLVWTALSWQISSIGMLGLIFEVSSSLFSNVISTLGLPIVPILAVIFFHDEMNGAKVIAMVLAVWGFASYMYQHYLDDSKAKIISKANEVSSGNEIEIC